MTRVATNVSKSLSSVVVKNSIVALVSTAPGATCGCTAVAAADAGEMVPREGIAAIPVASRAAAM